MMSSIPKTASTPLAPCTSAKAILPWKLCAAPPARHATASSSVLTLESLIVLVRMSRAPAASTSAPIRSSLRPSWFRSRSSQTYFSVLLAYASKTLKYVWDDLLRNQLGLSEDRIGAEVEAAGALDILTKTIKDSNVKTELDAVACRAGGAAQSFQGKIAFADVHGARGVDAVFGIEDIIQETVTPGYSQAVPVFYGDYDYDLSTGTF